MIMQLQAEAALLKSLPDTKVVAVGITDDINEDELNIIASSPENVILVEDFANLASIEEQLLDQICGKRLSSSSSSSSSFFSSYVIVQMKAMTEITVCRTERHKRTNTSP